MVNKTSYLKCYAISTICLITAFATFNGIVDPIQFYKKSFYPPIYLDNQRYQNPGLIKNYPFDTIILGTSHTENFMPSEIERKYGAQVLKLSMRGSTAYEQALALEKALQTGKVQRVIWGLEYNAFAGESDRVRHDKAGGEFPYYLYQEKWYTPFRYLVSWDTFTHSLKALQGKGHTELETLNTWFQDYEFGADKVLNVWQKAQVSLPQDDDTPIPTIDFSVQKHLLKFVQDNPNVEFYFFFPPYSILSHVFDYQYCNAKFEKRQYFKQKVIDALLDCKNCELYDFQMLKEITHNLNNYTDLTHYSKGISDYIIDSIFSAQHQVDRQNYQAQNRILVAQVKAYSEQHTQAYRQNALYHPVQ